MKAPVEGQQALNLDALLLYLQTETGFWSHSLDGWQGDLSIEGGEETVKSWLQMVTDAAKGDAPPSCSKKAE